MNTRLDYIRNILMQHKDKPFVRRIHEIGRVGEASRLYPYIQNQDNSISTHLMATSEMDGRYFAYPTIAQDPKTGKLIQYEDDEAFYRAMETGNFIEFPTQEEADYFSRNYKTWNK